MCYQVLSTCYSTVGFMKTIIVVQVYVQCIVLQYRTDLVSNGPLGVEISNC
jgi:hypothetical protein